MIDFSPRGAAQKLEISLNATYSALWTGRLRAEKRDGKWSIPAAAVDEYLQRRRSREIAKNAPSESRNFVGSEPVTVRTTGKCDGVRTLRKTNASMTTLNRTQS